MLLVSFGCSKLGLPAWFCVSVCRAWKGSKLFLNVSFWLCFSEPQWPCSHCPWSRDILGSKERSKLCSIQQADPECLRGGRSSKWKWWVLKGLIGKKMFKRLCLLGDVRNLLLSMKSTLTKWDDTESRLLIDALKYNCSNSRFKLFCLPLFSPLNQNFLFSFPCREISWGVYLCIFR